MKTIEKILGILTTALFSLGLLGIAAILIGAGSDTSFPVNTVGGKSAYKNNVPAFSLASSPVASSGIVDVGNVYIGPIGTSQAGTNSVVIGNLASQVASIIGVNNDGVSIGDNSAAQGTGIAIGNGTVGGDNCVSVGSQCDAFSSNSITIGNGSQGGNSGGWNISIGTTVGDSAGLFTNLWLLGHGISGGTKDNQFIIGGNNPTNRETIIRGRVIGDANGMTNIPCYNAGGTTGNATLAANTTFFFQPHNSSATAPTVDVSAGTRELISRTLYLTNLYIICNPAPGGAQTVTVTIMTNGVASSITKAISAAATTGNDTVHFETIVAGTEIGIRIVTSATSAATKVGWAYEGFRSNL